MDDEKAAIDAIPEAEVVEEVAQEEPKPRARRRQKKSAEPHPLAGKVVRGSGPAYFHVDERGRLRLIPDAQVFYRLGLQTVIRLPDDELAAMERSWDLR